MLLPYFVLKSTVVPDDAAFVRDGPVSPEDRTRSPGPDPDPQSDPQSQTPLLERPVEPGRRRAVAHVRPISIADIVRDVSGPDPMRVIRDFDRAYMPEGVVVVNSAVVGQSGEARRSELKRKAENISRSYSEVFAMLQSGNTSQAEAARILKTITNVAPIEIIFSWQCP